MIRRLALVLLTLCAGCADPAGPPTPAAPVEAQTPPVVRSSGGGADYETVMLTLPRGSADAGRQTFVDLRCSSCHTVEGDSGLPAPVSDSPGPPLGPALSDRPPGSVATAIVAPSHAMSIRTSPETRANVEGVLSPMGDYSDTMTVRQLVDLIAYLDEL